MHQSPTELRPQPPSGIVAVLSRAIFNYDTTIQAPLDHMMSTDNTPFTGTCLVHRIFCNTGFLLFESDILIFGTDSADLINNRHSDIIARAERLGIHLNFRRAGYKRYFLKAHRASAQQLWNSIIYPTLRSRTRPQDGSIGIFKDANFNLDDTISDENLPPIRSESTGRPAINTSQPGIEQTDY